MKENFIYIVISIIIITISTRPHFGTDLCLDTSPDPLGISSESQSGLLERDPNTSLKEAGKLSTITSLWATRITSYSRRAVSPLWPSTQLPSCVYSQGPLSIRFVNECVALTTRLRWMWKGLVPTCLRSQMSFQTRAQDPKAHLLLRQTHLFPLLSCRQSPAVQNQGKEKQLFTSLCPVYDLHQSAKTNQVTKPDKCISFTSFNIFVQIVCEKLTLRVVNSQSQ